MPVSRNDDEAFEAFVRSHGTTLVRLAGALTGDPGFREEAVQSALERVYLRWRRLDWEFSASGTYVYLPPTPANTALFKVPIPKGYPRSSPENG